MRKILSFVSALTFLFVVPTIVLAGNPPDQSHSSYPSFSSSYPADGNTTVSISVTLHDSSGNPIDQGDVIVLSTSDGTANFPTNNVHPDSSGVANFTMTSTTAGSDSITVTDTTTSTTFANWFSISFYAAATPTASPSDSCSNVPSAPVLTTVVSKSNNTATLTWVDSANPVSNYIASYGTTPGKYIYGAPNIGGQGTTSYTIGSLSSNKTYYFVVAAANKCGVSSFSSEVSTIVNPVPATPTPTIGPTTLPDVPALVSDTPTDVPTDTPSPTSTATVQGGNSTFRDLGIGIVVVGVLLIGLVVVFQVVSKKKNKIPPIHGDNTPQQPNMPIGSNFPQQPEQPTLTSTPPVINNPPPISTNF